MARDDRQADENAGRGPASDAELAARLDRLSRSLERGESEKRRAAERPKASATGYAMAFRLASEFVAGVLVGAGLGWALDKLAGTSPWGLIGLLLLGFAAGVMNVLRVAGKVAPPPGGAGVGGPGG